MSNVVYLPPKEDKEYHYNVWAMCICCSHRWIATVHFKTSVFALECPACKEMKSFASFIPSELTEQFRDE